MGQENWCRKWTDDAAVPPPPPSAEVLTSAVLLPPTPAPSPNLQSKILHSGINDSHGPGPSEDLVLAHPRPPSFFPLALCCKVTTQSFDPR